MIEKLEGRFLVTFLAVLEEKSFSKAAERLGYVQSTVTSQMRQLEEAAGQKLFDRLPRGVELTGAGRKLEIYARRFVQLGRELEEQMNEEGAPRGIVRLRVLESFAAAALWGPLRSFMEAYPDIEVQIEAGFQAETLEAVRSRQADMGLVPADPCAADLAFDPLLEDELLWIAAPREAEAVGREGWSAVRRMRIAGFGERCMYSHAAEAQLAAQRTAPAGRAEFASMDMIKRAAGSGWALALVPRSAVAAELAAGVLAECVPLGRQPICHGLIRHKQREAGRAAQLLHRYLLGCGMKEVMIE